MPPHDSRYMESERFIPMGGPGAGPTLVEDLGLSKPLWKNEIPQAWALHECLMEGRIPLLMKGLLLQGAYMLERSGDAWHFRKLDDEYANTAPLNWTGISAISGRTLADLIPKDMMPPQGMDWVTHLDKIRHELRQAERRDF